jgi:hypothetical protein
MRVGVWPPMRVVPDEAGRVSGAQSKVVPREQALVLQEMKDGAFLCDPWDCAVAPVPLLCRVRMPGRGKACHFATGGDAS